MSSIKLLWLPGPAHYRARFFAGPNTQHRAFAGDLTLAPAEAQLLHDLLDVGDLGPVGDEISQTGWVAPELVVTPAARLGSTLGQWPSGSSR